MSDTVVCNTSAALVAEGEALFASGEMVEAFTAFTAASGSDDATVWMWLSTCHAEGAGTPVSTELAQSCLRYAAELGQPQAQSNLGVKLIEQGPSDVEGGTQIAAGDDYTPSADVLEGLDWLRKAAAQQDVGACFNLATILSRGKEIAPLWREAAEAYGIAAEAGHYPSQIRLGFCYRNGFGVPKDRVQAFLWTALAARHGVGTALEQLEKIVFEMSARERADGEDLLRARADPDVRTRGAVPFSVVTN